MQISPISYEFNKFSYQRQEKDKVSFKNVTKPLNKGFLKKTTIYKMDTILHAYRDIIEKLSHKSAEGIQFINQNIPNVSIKDCLIFHNCGDDKSSIAIKSSDCGKSLGLTHITKRQGNSSWSERIVLDSYMVEDNNKLLSEFKPNYMNTFPEERKFLSQEEILEKELDEKLQAILDDLEPAMLKLRIYLAANADKYRRIPDGKIPYEIFEKMKNAERLAAETKEISKEVPRLQLYKLSKSFDEYLPMTGNMTTYAFQNLGDDKVTITLAPIQSQIHQNLKRLAVYNQDGSMKKVFLIQDNKLVSNTSPQNATYIADNLEFYNEKDILKSEVSGELEKYLDLYTRSLVKYNALVKNRAKKLADKKIVGHFTEEITQTISTASELAKYICNKYSDGSLYVRSAINQNLDGNAKIVKNKISFNSKTENKVYQIMTVNSGNHENLVKFIVQDFDTETETHYLIHEGDKLVKNYWPNSPTIIPKTLKYVEESEMPDIKSLMEEIKSNLQEIKVLTDEATSKKVAYEKPAKKVLSLVDKPKIVRNHSGGRPTKGSIRSFPEYKDLISSCKTQFSSALKSLDGGMEEFNRAIQEIQGKVAKFYEEHK